MEVITFPPFHIAPYCLAEIGLAKKMSVYLTSIPDITLLDFSITPLETFSTFLFPAFSFPTCKCYPLLSSAA